MRLIVTRPRHEAVQWVRDLQAAGWEAQALPLIDISPVTDRAPLARAWSSAQECAALMFVSANAVRCFLKKNRRQALYFLVMKL